MDDIDSAGESDEQTVSLRATYSLEEGGFFRRECNVCGLEYKVQIDANQLSALLSLEVQRVFDKAMDNPASDDDQEGLPSYCPYCGTNDDEGNSLTIECRDYLVRVANRELVYPAIRDFQRELGKIFGNNRSSNSGFISIEMNYKAGDTYLPPRPISGPPLPDMRFVTVLCCQERVKILENWDHEMFCPSCGEKLVII